MSTVEVRVPDMGNFDSVTVIEVLVKVGDSIDIDTPLATLETDKATMDVPSTAKGVVEKIHIAKGGSVSAGALIVTVKGAASETAAVGVGDAIPIRIGESSQFTNGGSAPLELFVMGVARDMAAKTQLLTGAPR